ncbi:hypothetical protein VPH35_069106 [Triticum aestivum]
MEFRHVSKLIDLFVLPLVKCYPRELLGEWILKLLLPLLTECGYALSDAWLNLLNEGQGYDRLYLAHSFGYLGGSEERVKKLQGCLLLDMTRKVSKLLGVLASVEPNDALMCLDLLPGSTVKTASLCDSKCAATNSVVGYTILDDWFMRMLNMNLFGSWVDGEATMDVLPFCHALVQVAVATKHVKLRRFIVDAMLPATIKRLCDDLPCAVQQTIRKLSCHLNPSKSKKATEDLWVLCEEIYKVFIQNPDFTAEGPDRENTGDRFKNWFSRQNQELLVKSSCPIPEDFPVNLWNWELEDEFQRYLPIYVDILYEADAMDCPEYEYPCQSTLFEKLRPEFRLEHGISNSLDGHVRIICNMVHRKLPAAWSEMHSRQMDEWLCKLISSKHYITDSNKRHSAMARFMEDLPIDAKLSPLDVKDAIATFYNVILYYLEPKFHPLIREGQKDFLIKVAHQFNFAQEANSCKPLEPELNDFPVYLQPYACSYIYRMKIECKYFEAREHVRLHQEFDQYLASGELDDDVYKFNSSQDKSVLQFAEKHVVKSRFGKLDHKLMKLSLEDRGPIVDTQRQIDTYSENLRDILANKELNVSIQKLMNKLEEEGFFDVDNDSIDWGKPCFVSLIDRFKELVFKGHGCPRHVVVQGIMEYLAISQRSGVITGQFSLEKVVEEECRRWKGNIADLWMDTRYYEESYHDLLRNPLKKII